MRHAFRLTSLAVIAPVLTLMMPVTAAMESSPLPESAKVLPSDTAYVILRDMQDETWQQLAQYAFYQVIESQGEDLLERGGLPFLPAEMNYATEIAPWVGDTTALALLPLGTPRATKLANHEVLVAPIAQPENFNGFIETVTVLRESVPETQVYQGVSIRLWDPVFFEPSFEDFEEPVEDSVDDIPEMPSLEDKNRREVPADTLLKALPEEDPEVVTPEEPTPDIPGLAIAVLPEFLIAAENPTAIRAWIDQRPTTEADSLASQERFQRTLAHPEYEGALGAFYGNLAELVKYAVVDFSLPSLPLGLPSIGTFSREELANLASLQLDTSIEVLLYPKPHGMRVQGRGYYDDTILRLLQPFVQPASPEVLTTVPDASYLMFSGQNLAEAWQQVAIALEAREETAELVAQARAFFQILTGLDLDQEFFGWMDQGFTVFLFPTRQTPLGLISSELHVGLGIALQTSDRAAAEYAFSQLDENLGMTFATVEPHALNEQTASSWTIDFAGDGQTRSFLGHGWANDDTLVVTTSIGSLSEILNLATRRQLPSSPIFQRAIQGYPNPNQGYVYSNLGSVQWLLYRFLSPVPQPGVVVETTTFQEVLNTIQALSGTVAFAEDYLQLDGTLLLSPAE